MFETGIETKYGIELPKKPSDLPYKEATLNTRNNDIKRRWYIEFWAMDESTGKLKRKQVWLPSQYRTPAQRRNYAEGEIRKINRLLAKGACFKKPTTVPAYKPAAAYTLPAAMSYALEIKNSTGRKDTKKSYRSCVNHWLNYCKRFELEKLLVTDVSPKHIHTFLDYLLKDLGNSTTTRNNNLGFSKALFNLLIERGVMEANPCKGIKEMKEETSRYVAFTDEQVQELKAAIQPDQPLYIAVLLLYYCFIRPKEIRLLQLKYVDFVRGKITVPAPISKNGKTETVSIPGPLRKELERLGLHQLPGEYYLTGTAELLPGEGLTKRFTAIARPLGYGPEYTLYSWKHTGVVRAYRGGIDIKAIQRQCRHSGVEITDKYLRSLGLFENKEIEDNFPEM